MSKRLSKPCAQWAEQLTQASFDHLSGEMSAELKAHLSICPACAAAHAEYRYTAAALRQAPAPQPLPGLPVQVLRAWAAEEQRHASAPVTRIKEVFMQTTQYETNPSPPPTPPARWQHISRRTSAAISAIAAVLVIAVVTIALLASHTSGKPTSPTATQTASQAWQALPHLANLSLDQQATLLAPSNPRVVYQIVITNQGTRVSLRRSDDQGATWKNVAAPPGAETTLGLYISHSNPQHVLANNIMEECPSGQTASAGSLSPLSSGHACSALYFSSNGGNTWAPVTIPAHTSSQRPFLGMGIYAQENRLYAPVIVEPGPSSSALIMSKDDGATWQFVDQGLNTEQHCIQDVAVPSSGTTLFATTLDHCGGAVYGTDTAQIWRSDNAGAHWTRVGSLSATSAFLMEAVNVSGQAQPVLIDRGSPPTLDSMRFSHDNGKTWQLVPTLKGQELANSGQLGVLRDGSILEQTPGGFYAWKAGDADWHKVAPALAGMVEGSLVVSDSASGKETLYLEVLTTGRQHLNFYRITLA